MYAILSSAGISCIALVGLFTIGWKSKKVKDISYFLVALAAGTLLGDTFFHLLPEALEESSNVDEILFAVLMGILVLFIFEKYLHWHHHGKIECEECGHSRHNKVLYMTNLFGDGLHNFLDGIAIAAAFGVSPVIGLSVTLAVALHEIPQEIADFGILMHAGFSKSRALFFNFISGLTSIAGAIIYIAFAEQLEPVEPLIIAFVAGVFLQISLSDLFVEIKESKRKLYDIILFGMLAVGLIIMYALRFLE
ncbi:ZIP family metal transporter [Candidatus Dojkabacteria bacterium]|nr:ZIP family metal transporter [Candidatus Dojkabacteria bacterium]